MRSPDQHLAGQGFNVCLCSFKSSPVNPPKTPVGDQVLVGTTFGLGTTFGRGRLRPGAELFKLVGTVRGKSGLDDVVPVRDQLGGVPELGCGALGVGLLVDQGGDGLSEGVRGDPFEARADAGLAPLAAYVLRGQPGAAPGDEDRVVRVCNVSGTFC
jgi:hypothetical protein